MLILFRTRKSESPAVAAKWHQAQTRGPKEAECGEEAEERCEASSAGAGGGERRRQEVAEDVDSEFEFGLEDGTVEDLQDLDGLGADGEIDEIDELVARRHKRSEDVNGPAESERLVRSQRLKWRMRTRMRETLDGFGAGADMGEDDAEGSEDEAESERRTGRWRIG